MQTEGPKGRCAVYRTIEITNDAEDKLVQRYSVCFCQIKQLIPINILQPDGYSPAFSLNDPQCPFASASLRCFPGLFFGCSAWRDGAGPGVHFVMMIVA